MEFTTIMEGKKYRKPQGKACRERKKEKFTTKMNTINLPQLSCSRVVLDKKYLLSESEEKIMEFKFYLHSNYPHYGYRQIKELVSLAELDPTAPVLQKYWNEIEEKRLKALSAVNLVNNGEFLKSQTIGYFSPTTSTCGSDASSTAVTTFDEIAVTDVSEVRIASTVSSFSLENDNCNSSVIKKIVDAPNILNDRAGVEGLRFSVLDAKLNSGPVDDACISGPSCDGADCSPTSESGIDGTKMVGGCVDNSYSSESNSDVSGSTNNAFTFYIGDLTAMVKTALLLLKKVIPSKDLRFSLPKADNITLCGVTLCEKLAIRLGPVDYLLSRSNMKPIWLDVLNVPIETSFLCYLGQPFQYGVLVLNQTLYIKI